MNTTNGNATAQSEDVEIGAMIREAREALGYELSDVAARLHIRIVHLEAIEAGKLSELPGPPYVSGFLRAYADLLGIDSDEILRKLRTSGVNIGKRQTFDLPSPIEEGRLPTRPIFFLAAVIALAAYGGWHYLYSYEEDSGNGIADWEVSGISGSGDARFGLSGPPDGAVPTRVPGDSLPSVAGVGERQAPEPPPASQNSPPPPPAAGGTGFARSAPQPRLPADASQPATSRQAAPALEPRGLSYGPMAPTRGDGAETGADAGEASVASAAPPEDAAAETRVSPPAPPPDSAVPRASAVEAGASPDSAGDGEATAGIVVRAIAGSFILVRDEDGNELYSGMMQPGDAYEVPPGEKLLLDTGNAGGLRLVVDGQEAPPLGSAGEVLRGVSLDRRLLGR